MEKKYQVFISSTYKDLIEERKKVLNILLMADCIPAGMEAFVATDLAQFEVIKKVIDLCDYYVLITATIRQVSRIFQTGFSRSAFQMAMMPMIGVKKIHSSTLPNVTFFFGSSLGIVQRSPCTSMPAGVPQFGQKLPANSVPHLLHRCTKVLPPQAVQKAFPSLFSVPQFLQIFILFPPYLLSVVMILFSAVVAHIPDKNPDQPQPIRSADQKQIHQRAEAALSSCHAITSFAGIHIENMIFTREKRPHATAHKRR